MEKKIMKFEDSSVEIIVSIENVSITIFDNLEAAIRSWDSLTWNRPNSSGSIVVREYVGDNCMRDCNILNVASGVVYLNPNLTLA